MNILVLNGSPRRKGNTASLLAVMVKTMEEAGGTVETVRLCDLNIQGCIGCGGCEHTGKCVLEDDMQPLYEKIVAADRIILGSPIYFYGITSQAKAFVDRTQALWSWKRLMREKGEWREDLSRKGYLVSVAATHGAKVFDGAILTARYAFDAMGVAYGGEFLVRGIDRLGEMMRDTEKLEQASLAAKKFML